MRSPRKPLRFLLVGCFVLGVCAGVTYLFQLRSQPSGATTESDSHHAGSVEPAPGDSTPAQPNFTATYASPPHLANSSKAPPTKDAYLERLEELQLSDKEAALAWARAGEAWFPEEGVLREARHAVEITLLVDLGQMREARPLTRTFIKNHPHSRYLPLVQGVTGIHPRPGKPKGI